MSSRPSSALREAVGHGRVPGGFDSDEPAWSKESSTAGSTAGPAEDSSLPSLPLDDSSSFHARSDGGSHVADHELDGNAEQEMRQKLMDFESSFLPVPSPSNEDETPRDMYRLEGMERKAPPHPSTTRDPDADADPFAQPKADADARLSRSPPTPPETYRTPAPQPLTSPSEGGSLKLVNEDDGRSTPAFDALSSSPTAAAAARAVSRVVSMASVSGYETADEGMLERQCEEDLEALEEQTPRKPQGSRGSHDQATRQPTALSSDPTIHIPGHQHTEDRPERQDFSERSNRANVRPDMLGSRKSSHRSTASTYTITSFKSEETGSDVTLGADYALQSGGAAPEDSSPSRHNLGLLRTTSLGSIASGITGVDEPTSTWEKTRVVSGTQLSVSSISGLPERGLSRLDEEERDPGDHTDASAARLDGPGDTSLQETPKASARILAAPADTVIAQHVRDVKVPPSVAREFRERNPPASPEKKPDGRNSLSGRTKGLTLKEQSSTIDRLQKENFDLKLKVHYLNKALNERSDEGVKEMISENVELKVGLATMEKQNRTLRRTVADLERRLSDKEESKADSSPDTGDSDDDASPSTRHRAGGREVEEEVVFLRERLEVYEREVERLMNEGVAKEGEKRRLAELVKSFGEKKRAYFDISAREEMDMWKDLYEAETARREQADESIKKLQDEISRLKNNGSVATTNGHARSLLQTRRGNRHTASHSLSTGPDYTLERNSAVSAASSTLVEQLRHENEELRREVSAQTSMLTSRNREKERLYQEIEDLKLGQMRGEAVRSIAGDSIFERSASRAYQRPASRASALTRSNALNEAEREEYEQREGQLRDVVSELKLANQELEKKLNDTLDELEQHERAAAHREKQYEEELELATRDLQTMQSERDEVLVLREELETEFENLKQEAQQEINSLEADLDQRIQEVGQLERELSNRSETFSALQTEMRSMSEVVVRLEDDHRSTSRKMASLQQELSDANKELEVLEKNLREANAKIERFTVQQESSQGEITFLREEQDADKMKIGDLESALKKANDCLLEAKENVSELEARIVEERRQHEMIASQEKEGFQRIANELNHELTTSRDEVRKLRKNLSSREVEATEWKERLIELENNLRAALGDLSGTRSSLLKSVTKLQKELEATVADLERTKNRLAENERILRHRDALLESAGLETRKLSEMLDKERQARKVDRHHYEQLEKTTRQTARAATQQEGRVLELETARQGDRRKYAAMEAQFKEQLMERNNLLLALWNRLSTMCGTEWAHKHSQVNGKLPSIEVVSTMLSGFSKNLLFAVKTIEGLVGGFKIRIRNIEKDLWRDYQTLEHNLDIRSKKLDRLEAIVHEDLINPSSSSFDIARLKNENKSLKAELKTIQRQDSSGRPGRNSHRYPTPGLSSKDINPAALASLTRHYSTSAVETIGRLDSASSGSATSIHGGGAGGGGGSISSASGDPSEQRWIHRLRELEKRLKAEREARLQDRNGARKRLEEGRAEYEELKMQLERDRVRNGEV